MVRCQQLCATRYGWFGFREEALPTPAQLRWERTKGLEHQMMIAMVYHRGE